MKRKVMSTNTAVNVGFWQLLITCILMILPLLSSYLQVFGLSEQVMLVVQGTVAFISGALAIVLKIFFTEKPLPAVK
jgi:hypothetical protein